MEDTMNKTIIALAAATAGLTALIVQAPAAEARGFGFRVGFGPSLFHSYRPPLYEGSGSGYRYSDDRGSSSEEQQEVRRKKAKIAKTPKTPKTTHNIQQAVKQPEKLAPVAGGAPGVLGETGTNTTTQATTMEVTPTPAAKIVAQDHTGSQLTTNKNVAINQPAPVSAPQPTAAVDCKQFVPSAGLTISVPCAQ
jgi:hypothetical protein